MTAEVVEMNGAVELAPRLQIANFVCDLVSTGATLEANGLKAVETVLESEAVSRADGLRSLGRLSGGLGFFARGLEDALRGYGIRHSASVSGNTGLDPYQNGGGCSGRRRNRGRGRC